MCKLKFCFLLSWAISLPLMAAGGFKEIRIDQPALTQLSVALWYPARQDGKAELVGDNPAFKGIRAERDATPEAGAHPLVVFSHGYGGNWRNLAWLAAALAERGFIVAAPNHPGTTTGDLDAERAHRLWLRPASLRLAVDRLIADPSLAGKVDTQRIAAAGHSLGGWTVMMLAGARFSPRQFIDDCRQHATFSSCRLTARLGINLPDAENLSGDLADSRVKAVVALDPGLMRGLTSASLAKVNIPVLIMGAQVDLGGLPAEKESGYLATYLSASVRRYEIIPGTTHFSFMQLCKPGAQALIEAEAPGEGVVCHDGGRAGRAELHQRLIEEISDFLFRSLNFHPRYDDNARAKGQSAAEIPG